MLTAIGEVMRKAYERGWLSTRDGNISLKYNKHLYITPSGIRKYLIQPEDVIKIPVSKDDDGYLCLEPGHAVDASIELDLHWNLQSNPKVKTVVHLHPTHTIAAMYAGWDLRKLALQFPELGRYTKVGRNVPSYKPGSSELAEATYQHMMEDKEGVVDIVGLDRHGVVALGKNPWDAFEHIERLNHICEIVLASGVKPDVK